MLVKFEWGEEIPRIGRFVNGNIFHNRIFNAFVKKGKIVKFSTSFLYDGGKFVFKIKAIEGAELLTDYGMEEFTYRHRDSGTCIFQKSSKMKDYGGYCYQMPIYSNHKEKFLKQAEKAPTNKVTFTLTIYFEPSLAAD